jgi:hypothetical protein
MFLAANELAVIRHFQERMPYGLFVPDELPTFNELDKWK